MLSVVPQWESRDFSYGNVLIIGRKALSLQAYNLKKSVMDVQMEAGWKQHLAMEFEKAYFVRLTQFVLAPSFIAVSMPAISETPSILMKAASLIMGIRMRLTTKPAASLT